MQLYLGDCLEVMAGMEPNSVDSIITDPPYGLLFMGKDWDHGIPGIPFWQAALRVAKPGAILMAFGGTRTFHRLACAIEDAGWEIRDTMMWVYGSGFPKSHNLDGDFDGWGTALKPAWEPIIIAMKPCDGTFAQNAEKWGVAGFWIDGGRIPIGEGDNIYAKNPHTLGTIGENGIYGAGKPTMYEVGKGRWPANLIHDGSDEVVGLFPMTNGGALRIATRQRNKGWCNSSPGGGVEAIDNFGDSGSAARFFYAAKSSRSERTCGGTVENGHPTCKPVSLMRYLCRLTKTPTGGVVLDPFMGSGTTGVAAIMEGRDFIGIEKEPEYMAIAERRIENARLPLLEV